MARAFGRAHNSYSRYFNQVRGRSGHLWQNRFYSAPLGHRHLVSALRYVDLNPVRARLVERALDYEWSSARAHVAARSSSCAGTLNTKHGLTLAARPRSTIQTSPRRGSAMLRFFSIEGQENPLGGFHQVAVLEWG